MNTSKTIGTKVKLDEIGLLNQRLKIYGFDTVGDLIRDFINGKFPLITEDKQVAILNQSGTGKLAELMQPTFWENINYEDVKKYYKNVKKLQSDKHINDMVSYFRRFKEIFFGKDPEQILNKSGHVRAWITYSMRGFADYYFYKYGNAQMQDLVDNVIKRYQLSKNTRNNQRIYIVDDNYIKSKVDGALSLQDPNIQVAVKMGIASGLREHEIIYAFKRETCPNLGGCECSNLHVLQKGDLVVVTLNWFRGQKKVYFAILPAVLWKQFRAWVNFDKTNIGLAHIMLKQKVGIQFMQLRKLHYNVMCRVLDMAEADILQGRAKTVSAKHYALYELDKLATAYVEAWDKFGVKIEQLSLDQNAFQISPR